MSAKKTADPKPVLNAWSYSIQDEGFPQASARIELSLTVPRGACTIDDALALVVAARAAQRKKAGN